MNATALLALLQSADSTYPTGAYAHSFGLEGFVEAGLVRDVVSLEALLAEHALPALAHAELPYVRLAHAAAAAQDLDLVCALDEECAALRGARELREAGSRIGAQRVALAAELLPSEWNQRLQRALDEGHWRGQLPVAYGALCAGCGTRADDAVAAYTYQQLAGAMAAAMKLLRLGQRAAQGVLTRLLAASIPWQERSAAIPREEAGWFTPGLDIASARHETAYTRLFIS